MARTPAIPKDIKEEAIRRMLPPNNESPLKVAITREEPGLCGCYIDLPRGALKVTDVYAEDYPAYIPGLPEGSYHIYDYQFFYRNLQDNVKLRIAEYLSQAMDVAA